MDTISSSLAAYIFRGSSSEVYLVPNLMMILRDKNTLACSREYSPLYTNSSKLLPEVNKEPKMLKVDWSTLTRIC